MYSLDYWCFLAKGCPKPGSRLLKFRQQEFDMMMPSEALAPRPVSVLVADQNLMAGRLLGGSLTGKSGFKIVGTAVDVDQALQMFGCERPDVVVIAVNLKDGPRSGFSLLRRLRAAHPGTRTVVLLDSIEDDLVLRAFRSGARGLFCRSGSVKMLRKCLLAVHRGQVWADTDQMQLILDAVESPAPLSAGNTKSNNQLRKREKEVLACVAAGLTNRQIAEQLNLSEHTVKNYLFRLCDKVGRSGRVELTLYALTCHELTDPQSGQSHEMAIPAP
jgi:two-component system nitrate/nitrite response regulator NarL